MNCETTIKKLQTGPKALDLIRHFESLHDGDLKKIGLQPKMDPVGIWTEGWGHAIRDERGSFVKHAANKEKAYRLASISSEKEAGIVLATDLALIYEPLVLRMMPDDVEEKLNNEQFGALTSFCYNCGTSYRNSAGKLIAYNIWDRATNYLRGKESADSLRLYWNKSVITSGGKVLSGLIRRRKTEAHLFLTGELKTQWID